MWPNNGFTGNGPYQGDFDPNGNMSSPFAKGLTGPTPGSQSNSQHFHQPKVNSTPGDFNSFQPNVGFYDNSGPLQNQQYLAPGPQFSPRVNMPQPVQTPHPRQTEEINARAAELKAKLLKGRESRANSATPSVFSATHKIKLGESGGRPMTMAVQEQELNVDDLISQYAPSAQPTLPILKVEEKHSSAPGLVKPREPSVSLMNSAKSLAPPAGSPAGPKNISKDGSPSTDKVDMKNDNAGDISEGEIFEEPPSTEVVPPTGPKQASIKKVEAAEQRRQSVDQLIRSTQDRGVRVEEPRRILPHFQSKPQSLNRDERRDDSSDVRANKPEARVDRRPHPDLSARSYDRYDPRDSHQDRERYEEFRRVEKSTDRVREEVPKAEEKASKMPTLSEFLATDPVLKEWLDATDYFNKSYRLTILNNRRKLAALDAQRQQLLAEMGTGPVPAISLATSTLVSPADSENRNGLPDAGTILPRDRVPSNKRAYNEIQDGRDEYGSAKIARIDDQGLEDDRAKMRFREEIDVDRPRPSGYDSYRADRRDSRDEMRSMRYEDPRGGRQRSMSREREYSPYYRHEPERFPSPGRYPDRRRSFDSGDRRPSLDTRAVHRGRGHDAVRGGRGRGRGGRGDLNGLDYSEGKTEPPFGTRIAASKPWMNPGSFDKGRKGDTRYFLVKSFNEDNVLNCISDSIWTTQLANGPPLTTAFNTSRNVILVFSINKSRAFQGYARMESLPGSVPVPEWQRAINWESAGAFRVRWQVICSTKFHRVGHLKNELNDGQPVLIGKDGQEIEAVCGEKLCALIEAEGEGLGWSAESAWREDDSGRG